MHAKTVAVKSCKPCHYSPTTILLKPRVTEKEVLILFLLKIFSQDSYQYLYFNSAKNGLKPLKMYQDPLLKLYLILSFKNSR